MFVLTTRIGRRDCGGQQLLHPFPLSLLSQQRSWIFCSGVLFWGLRGLLYGVRIEKEKESHGDVHEQVVKLILEC